MSDVVNEGVSMPPVLTPGPPRRRRAIVLSLVGVVLIVAITGVGLAATNSKTSSAGAAAVVRRALDSTLAESSLAFTVNESVNVAGTSLTATGNGECDLTSALCGVTMSYNGLLGAVGSIQVVYSNGTAYLNLGSAASALVSTPWISVPTGSSNSASLGVSQNPLSGLSVLAAQGATVTNEGAVTRDGEQMTQYTVSADAAEVKSLIASDAAKLPSWMAVAAKSVSSGTVTETVDVDSAGRLGYLQANANETVAGSTVGITVSELVTGYGVPVNVTVPPASQVTSMTSLSQLSGL